MNQIAGFKEHFEVVCAAVEHCLLKGTLLVMTVSVLAKLLFDEYKRWKEDK